MNQIFTKRNCCVNANTALGALCFWLFSFASFGQTRYTWQPSSGSTSWINASNWSPARPTPSADDILVFDGTLTPTVSATVDFATTQTIGQLIFANRVQAALNTAGDRTLTLGTLTSSIALQIEAGTVVQVIGTQGGIGLTLQLATNSRAAISGRLEFLGTTGFSNCTHQFTSTTLGAIEFLSGAYFLSGARFSGFPFGSLTANTGTVTFRSGATFEQSSGGSPFGERAFSVAVFDPESLFRYTAGSGNVGLSGRTFGHLTIDANRTPTAGTYGSNKFIVQNDLTILSGSHTFNVKEFDLKGNLLLNGGNLLFPPDAANALTLTFSGPAAQIIGGTTASVLTMGSNVKLVVNNPAGLTLQRPVQVNGSLALIQGQLTTTATNNLTLGAAAAVSGGSTASFVNGPLSRVQTGTATNLFFPIGSGKVYRPLTLTGQQADASTTYTAQQFNQAPTARAFPTAAGSLQRVSRVRYFNVTNNGATNFSQGTITLNYDGDDQVDAPAKLRIAKSDAAGNWLDLGGTGTGAPAGSITSTVPFTSFSDFVLASTEASGALGNNPLPVHLTSFTARRQGTGVRLQWVTATESNNSYFEVQRSADGQLFGALAKVPGHGSSANSQAYTFLDENAPTGTTLYYILRQVDADDMASYSPVEAVRPGATQSGILPNPAHEQISFPAAAEGSYRVLNMLGQPLLTGRAEAGLNTLELSSLGAGAYCLEVIGAAGRERHRFFKN